jgi:hypothetical protein
VFKQAKLRQWGGMFPFLAFCRLLRTFFERNQNIELQPTSWFFQGLGAEKAAFSKETQL